MLIKRNNNIPIQGNRNINKLTYFVFCFGVEFPLPHWTARHIRLYPHRCVSTYFASVHICNTKTGKSQVPSFYRK
jgi:hypothetical protein